MEKIITTLLLLVLYSGCSTTQPNKVSPKYAAGMGALLRENDGIEVFDVAEDYPADKAGIKRFDKILEIGGIPTLGLNLAETTLLIRGSENTKVILRIKSPANKKPHQVTITRKTMNPKDLKWKECMTYTPPIVTTEERKPLIIQPSTRK